MRLLSTGKSQSVNEYLSSWQSRYNELSPRIKDEESRESFKKIFKLFYDIDEIHKIDEQSEEMYFNAVLEKLVGNPVHVYSLLDRLVSLLPRVREELGQELDTEIEKILDSLQRPDDSDVEGATQALVRVQFAYRLKFVLPVMDNNTPVSGLTQWPCLKVICTEQTPRRG